MSLRHSTTDEGHRILEFWRKRVVLPDGGFHGMVNHQGEPKEDAPRSLILAARILWTFSRTVVSGFEDTAENRAIADKAFTDLQTHFWDPDSLGFHWMVTAAGEPLQPFKHAYGQAFAIYACAEYYRMSGRDEALKLAQFTYTLLERYAFDETHGGYYESFTAKWEINPNWDEGPVNHGGPKSMNSHLHLLEAFTTLYQVWPSERLRDKLIHLLDVMQHRIVNASTHQFHLFFQADWTPIGDVASYGHDIEGSWLMVEAAEVLGNEERLESTRRLAVLMVNRALAEGLDADGGLMNEGRQGSILDTGREWWQQAEALVGCVNAYQITKDPSYLKSAEGVWSFIQSHVVDPVHGEWIGRVEADGTYSKSAPKVSAWKCPYHNARACMELFHRLGYA